MPTDHASFLHAMAQVPTPVTVVTTRTSDGHRYGFTASAFCSLSARPPLILVCLAKTSSCHPAFTRTGSFMVNLLAEDHQEVARAFARGGQDKFTDSTMTECELGLPGLPDAAARLACTTHAVLDGGDHSILVGQVERTAVLEQQPLVYHNRQFAGTRPHAMATT